MCAFVTVALQEPAQLYIQVCTADHVNLILS